MSEWKPKRFWQDVSISKISDGYLVLLDGKPVKTPAKAPLVLPTLKLAEAVTAEWLSQNEEIDPSLMPFTSAANAALDKIENQLEEVQGLIAAYAETDLLCYRAIAPRELVQRQEEAWDPLLNWSEVSLGAPLNVTNGVIYVDQPKKSVQNLLNHVSRYSSFELAALYDLVGLSGSLIASLAVIQHHESPESVWEICQVDEIWQKEQWGQDELDAKTTLSKRMKFLQAFEFFSTLN